jgi:phosphoribosylformylglycinamidine synthase
MKFAVLVFPGTWSERDCQYVLAHELGQQADLVWHRESDLSPYDAVVIPGGFSYGDHLRTGAIARFSPVMEAVVRHADAGKPVIGICNGFQALVKSGILPGGRESRVENSDSAATLTFNAMGHFECRWVSLRPVSQACVWTKGLTETIECPIAHGEGNFQTGDGKLLSYIDSLDLIALAYVHPDGSPAKGAYPANPNGSVLDIAGLTNPAGNVLGLMPHPENHIHPWHHPQWSRGVAGGSGLALFRNGVSHVEA